MFFGQKLIHNRCTVLSLAEDDMTLPPPPTMFAFALLAALTVVVEQHAILRRSFTRPGLVKIGACLLLFQAT